MKRILFTFLILVTFCSSKANPDSAVCKIQTFINDWYKTPYKFGGTSKSGIDCSAFVKKLYKSVFDIDLPRTCKQQIKNISKITQDRLEAGSIIFLKWVKVFGMLVFIWKTVYLFIRDQVPEFLYPVWNHHTGKDTFINLER